MAETVATTAGGIVLDVVTGGRDYKNKSERHIQTGNSAFWMIIRNYLVETAFPTSYH